MTSDKVKTRELITFTVLSTVLRGTYHVPAAPAKAEGNPAKKLGILFLNSLSSPRSLIGDSAVYWAEAFAADGYPVFRVDLPGLGDSEGERPNDLLKFTNEGGYANAAAAVVKQLVKSRGLSGMLMFGHCAGATTALYAASDCKEVKGLILMDPYFNLPKSLTSTLRPELVNWARGSKTGAVIRAIYDRVREFPAAMGKGALPANANFSLLARCKRVVATGIPILVMKAPQPPVAGGNVLKAGSFDYLSYVIGLAAHRGQFTVETIEESDHSFANHAGRLRVRACAQAWLGQRFPDVVAVSPVETQICLVQERSTVTLGKAVSAQVFPGE